MRLLLLLACACCCGAADLYKVAGVVVNAETGAPLPRAYVAVQRTGSTTVLSSQVTGNDGQFAFNLAQGKYELHGGTRAALELYGRKAPDSLVSTAIVTGPDQKTDSLVFRWYPLGGISGRIVDDNGDPVEDALVQLIRSTVIAGQRATHTFGWTRTDDRGEYRFGRLLSSTYYLTVTARPWYSAAVGLLARLSPGPSVAYAPVYYPNSLDKKGAAPIALRSGEERRADFALHAVPGATVVISYDSPTGLKGTVGLLMDGSGADDGFAVQENVMPVGQTLSGVAPGRYLVQVRGTRGVMPTIGRQWIDVAGMDLAVKVAIRPLPAVTGTIAFQNAGMQPRGSVLASLVRIDTGAVSSATMRTDGTLAFGAVDPGKYRVSLRGVDGYFASQVRVEGAEFRNGIVELVEGTSVTLRIVASDATGRVQGFVMRDGRPVDGIMVVLAPVTEGDARGFQTDSDGSFDYTNVPAGEYYLFAVDDANLEYGRSQAIRPYFEGAKKIRVEAHGTHSERIGISR